MRQPEFWFKQPGVLSGILFPLEVIWRAAARNRIGKGRRERIKIPVICVGNLNVGGTGKTPLVMELARRLTEAGESPHAVSRGFGGNTSKPTLVDPSRHSATDVGDEPLLLSSFVPTWVGAKRPECARLAAEAGAGVIILDDGHQDPSLAHDISVIVVDAERGFGNCRVMPAGPLRETVDEGLHRADVVVVVGSNGQRFRKRWKFASDLPVIEAKTTVLSTGKDWRDERVVAFAGIGDPLKFFACLSNLGANVVHEVPLTDHQVLDGRLLTRLEMVAKSRSAQLVTTEKDAVRLPKNWRSRVLTLPVRLELSDWSEIDDRLAGLGVIVPDAG